MNDKELLSVFLNNIYVGKLDLNQEKYFIAENDSLPLFSLSLTEKKHINYRNKVSAYLRNLLPEVKRKNLVQNFFRTRDPHYILEQLGLDLAGAIQFYPYGQELPDEKNYTDITDKLFDYCCSNNLTKPRLNLAGAQEKVSLVYDAGHFYVSETLSPSTYIFKPDHKKYNGLARNESLCLLVAKKLFFDVPENILIQKKDSEGLLIKRYDRKREDSKITRIHQEDFCQMMGYYPEEKYSIMEIKTFSDFLLNFGYDCREELAKRMILFFFLGNVDAHAKNYSILHLYPGYRLAPLYDVVCIPALGNFSCKFSMEIGSALDLYQTKIEHIEKFAETMEVPSLVQYAYEMSKSFLDVLHEAVTEEIEKYGSHDIYAKIINACTKIQESYNS